MNIHTQQLVHFIDRASQTDAMFVNTDKLYEEQISDEKTRSRRHSDKHLISYYIEQDANMCALQSQLAENIIIWREINLANEELYESKRIRLQALALADVDGMSWKMIARITSAPANLPFASLIVQFATSLNWDENQISSVKNAADLLALACKMDLFDIYPNERGRYVVESNLEVPQCHQDHLEAVQVLPPMLTPAKPYIKYSVDAKWSVITGGHLSYNDSPVLNVPLASRNNHQEINVDLPTLNTQGNVALRLNKQFVNTVPFTPKKVLADDELARFTEFAEGSVAESQRLAGRALYFVHSYDNRGRLYAQGHQINYQGMPWQKAALELAESLPVSDGIATDAQLDDQFTPMDYLRIDIANYYGLDKLSFDERIQWVYDHETRLKALYNRRVQQHRDQGTIWKEAPQYLKAVMAYREVHATGRTSHIVRLDATASGLQIMAALSECERSCELTNLIDTTDEHGVVQRHDVYTEITQLMKEKLLSYGEEGQAEIERLGQLKRADVKDALMCGYYGSVLVPEIHFGSNTLALQVYHETTAEHMPGPTILLNLFLDLWDESAVQFSWQLPDGHWARVPVSETVKKRIEIDDLDHLSTTVLFTMEYPNRYGKALAANIVHSVDGYVVRNLIARCMCDRVEVNDQLCRVIEAMNTRDLPEDPDAQIDQIFDPRAHVAMDLDDCVDVELQWLEHNLRALLDSDAFDVISVHDEFGCHPKYMGQLRRHYRRILADISASHLLSDIVHELGGSITKDQFNTYRSIRDSTYTLS